MELNKSLELVLLDLSRPKATARIGTKMALEMRGATQQLLIEHHDVFTWSNEYMPKINLEIMQHHLCVDPKLG